MATIKIVKTKFKKITNVLKCRVMPKTNKIKKIKFLVSNLIKCGAGTKPFKCWENSCDSCFVKFINELKIILEMEDKNGNN